MAMQSVSHENNAISETRWPVKTENGHAGSGMSAIKQLFLFPYVGITQIRSRVKAVTLTLSRITPAPQF